jgi:hypothetical protein
MFFVRGKRGVKAPRLPRNSPQLHHEKTTLCTPLFAKTPAKTPLHHRQNNHDKYFPGIGFSSDSESQKI